MSADEPDSNQNEASEESASGAEAVRDSRRVDRQAETESVPPDGDDPSDLRERIDAVSQALPSIVGSLFAIFAISAPVVSTIFGSDDTTLEIVAAARLADVDADAGVGWKVTGRVLVEGDPAESVSVWAIAEDPVGNRFAPDVVKDDHKDSFEFDVPGSLNGGGEGPNQVTIYAREESLPELQTSGASDDTDESNVSRRGQETLGLGAAGQRWIEVPVMPFLSAPAILVVSILLALAAGRPARWRHLTLTSLAFLLTFLMITYVAAGIRFVSVTSSPGELLSLGFANIYHGTYVAGVPPEWVLSLTAPPITSDGVPDGDEHLITGFGAPLWVILLSVIGSALFTIALLVKQIGEPPEASGAEEGLTRIAEIVQHQFYVLFAPIGAVFVYQLLLMGGAANKAPTTALTVLGAGISLNFVLSRVVRLITGLFEEKES